jgi:beta-glucosidase
MLNCSKHAFDLSFFFCPSDFFSFFLSCFCRKKVAACAKHFVGDGGTTKGINENNTVIDKHGLLSIHMPAYSDSIIKGVSTIMVSYSSWNGEKMHANRELITGFLKNTLKFKVRFTFQF